MKSLVQILTLVGLVAFGSFAITGCSSKSPAPNKMGDKMSGDKMEGGKMSDDKMGSDKMGEEKMK